MVNVRRLLAVLSFVALGACGGSSESPQRSTEVEIPTTGLEVRATIASASLGDSSANVQLAFFASEATAPASIAITQVVLVNGTTGDALQTLSASDPSIWNGRSYETWNEKVTPGGDLRASYDLTAPTWSKIDGEGLRSSSSSYSTSFKLRITMRIDSQEITIESPALQREPQVAT